MTHPGHTLPHPRKAHSVPPPGLPGTARLSLLSLWPQHRGPASESRPRRGGRGWRAGTAGPEREPVLGGPLRCPGENSPRSRQRSKMGAARGRAVSQSRWPYSGRPHPGGRLGTTHRPTSPRPNPLTWHRVPSMSTPRAVPGRTGLRKPSSRTRVSRGDHCRPGDIRVPPRFS